MRLSPHFHEREFACHDGTAAPPRFLKWARELCQDYLEDLRREFGPVTVVSGYRTASHNRQVGGAPSSYHLSVQRRPGAAADVKCQKGDVRQWHAFLNRAGAPGLGFYSDHVHVDNRRGFARW